MIHHLRACSRAGDALAHPLIWAAAGLVLVNDFGLRGVAPGWLTGKLSDVGWLILVPVLLAAGLAAVGVRDRRGRALALVTTGCFYTVLQLWPPLGRVFKADHVADVGDLLVLPVLLGAVWVWSVVRPGRAWGWAAAPVLVAVLVADGWDWQLDLSIPCGEGTSWESDSALPTPGHHRLPRHDPRRPARDPVPAGVRR